MAEGLDEGFPGELGEADRVSRDGAPDGRGLALGHAGTSPGPVIRPPGTAGTWSCRSRPRTRSPWTAGAPRKLGHVRVRHLDAGQHPAEVGAGIGVVEQADVPAAAEGPQELQQGAGLLGKLEAVQALVLQPGARPPTMCRTCSLATSSSLRSDTG